MEPPRKVICPKIKDIILDALVEENLNYHALAAAINMPEEQMRLIINGYVCPSPHTIENIARALRIEREVLQKSVDDERPVEITEEELNRLLHSRDCAATFRGIVNEVKDGAKPAGTCSVPDCDLPEYEKCAAEDGLKLKITPLKRRAGYSHALVYRYDIARMLDDFIDQLPSSCLGIRHILYGMLFGYSPERIQWFVDMCRDRGDFKGDAL